jgi:hypothetical protein
MKPSTIHPLPGNTANGRLQAAFTTAACACKQAKTLLQAFTGALLLLLGSCKKDEVRAVLNPGTPPVLTASVSTLVLDSTNAASKDAITFSWPAADYGAKVAVTYTLQVDSAGKNFSSAQNVEIGTALSKTFTVAAFNTLVQDTARLTPGKAGQIEVRIKAAVNQNNGSASTAPVVYSNVVNVTVTPYSTKPQPKFPVPDSLYIIGDATAGGWNNPVPSPAQKFTRIDDNTFGIIIALTAGKQYVFLPKNGDWSHKYNVASAADPSLKAGGSFAPDAGNDNIPGPDVTGLYKIIVDFIKGTYTVTPVAAGTVPDNLFIVGDATAGGWNNPVPVPAQQFTKTNAGTFELTLPLTGGKEYLLLPLNGDWGHKYAVDDNTLPGLKLGGTFKLDAAKNIPGPDQSGSYKITVSFVSNQYTVTRL